MASPFLIFQILAEPLLAPTVLDKSVWMIDVFLCALGSLLMDQVQVTESCLLMGIQLEKYSRSGEFIGSRHSIIAGIKNVAGTILRELVFVQLKKADIRPGALFGVKTRFDFGNGLHKIEVQAEGVGCPFDLLNRRSDWNALWCRSHDVRSAR
jgi:hypothetical protein